MAKTKNRKQKKRKQSLSFDAEVGAMVKEALAGARKSKRARYELTRRLPRLYGMTPVTIIYDPRKQQVTVVARSLNPVPEKRREEFGELVRRSQRDVILLEEDYEKYFDVPRDAKRGQIISFQECDVTALNDEWPALIYAIRDTCWDLRVHVIALDALMSGDDVDNASDWFWRDDDDIEDQLVQKFMPFPDTSKRMKKLKS